MKRAIILAFPVVLATAFTAAPAFTLNGTVKSESGNPVAGASVKLLSVGETATTDSLGKFEIKKEDIPDGISGSGFAPGYISYADGILHFSQSSASPVHVAIYDMIGHQVLSQTLNGKGQVDLRQGVDAQGTPSGSRRR